MTTPARLTDDEVEYLAWLVPARSKIQALLLRLLVYCDKKQFQKRTLEYRLSGWSIGTAFSLWRACFQADKALHHDSNFAASITFLKKLVAHNSVLFGDELNSWSLGYYVGNARFRIIAMIEIIPEAQRTDTMKAALAEMKEWQLGDPKHGSQELWDESYAALECIVAYVETLNA